ncbi:polysaccharide biosynthesis C-terminal domain-containing protein [Flavitalea sp. BT771]|uniref:polysaccharide biosynthesis C-terminal domain-containing protein n=1 Tax=Flavitalea sp. BT771 TaxID=3063329 RepID=UPI0026E47D09|nr:polysaccharide biosynthesis C-terminal domain-containing protein [Flavitalea sp. BT771]MDO6431415.1 polysaccharide biosynthesis C-terminal domain-containing protein [Flavitalea sp. BT771]MDV6220323.1 polysaccharide biosynthesis C-terminal domain-containing protein [Flavitalea sp. BT771]
MSTIRRQSIISSGIVYIGFALGALNTLLLTKEFSAAQYGLITIFMSLANIMFPLASLGMHAYVYKFYPYYNDNLPPEKNDMMTWALVASFVGFLLVISGGIFFEDFVVENYSRNSPDLVTYYYWTFPFGLGLTFYSILEAFAWQLKKSVLTTYFREIQFRLFTFVLIVLFLAGALHNFDAVIKIYAWTYPLLALSLLGYLMIKRQLHFTFHVSRVTKKFFKKILAQVSLVWTGQVLFNISFYFAQLVIGAVVTDGMRFVGIYMLALYVGSLIQAIQRSVIAASIGPLSRAWKDKDYGRINRIYQRSSINQLIFSAGMFVLIWLNFTDGVRTFNLKDDYLLARSVFFYIGLTRVVDMGTGVNTQIIGTSTFWRFDFFTGIVLTILTLPANYFLTKALGYIGPAIADLVTFSIYNGIRFLFLYRKFGMQPFTRKTVYTLLLALAGYLVCYLLFDTHHGFIWLVLRSAVFIGIFGTGVLTLRLSDDILPVWHTIKKRLHLIR